MFTFVFFGPVSFVTLLSFEVVSFECQTSPETPPPPPSKNPDPPFLSVFITSSTCAQVRAFFLRKSAEDQEFYLGPVTMGF